MGEFTLNKEKVLKALSTVQEPDLKKDLVTLGMIQDIEIGVGQLSFTVVLTTPACPLKELIRRSCEEAIHTLISPEVEVKVNLTANVTSIRQGASLIPGVKNVIAISSGKGGVGKSTVTANLAMALHRSGASVGIIDADISGPSMPVMFGAENMQPTITVRDGKNFINPIRQYGIKMISIGFLTPPDSAVVWRGPMASQALRQFFGDTDWGELDYLLIDLPPGTSDIHLTLVQTVPVTGAVIVTTPQKVALADAQKGLAMFRQPQINVPVLGVVENMAYFTPAELPDHKYFIFGQGGGQYLADRYEVPMLGQIPLVQGIREAGDEGRPAVMNQDPLVTQAFQSVAQALAQQVAIRNASADKTKVVELRV
ncbi:ATP-binding protein involved in chromosome partitioning [Rhabdobacter roseus]|uniref:Iron-sulfur cluster carrier protein n=1 Tax=Rhabdobacter roseus TaxID=1655419 RepID=A0A840TY21_9BACT|nr:Mrp/NBP35 family ATP-binding protein [Rhabdobacter roseus]MBB5286502.1 ATP-binding protein involved in chromosome partitioning [Rhabdobacter roseus]